MKYVLEEYPFWPWKLKGKNLSPFLWRNLVIMRDNNCVLQFQLFSARYGFAAVKQPRNDHAMDEAGGM